MSTKDRELQYLIPVLLIVFGILVRLTWVPKWFWLFLGLISVVFYCYWALSLCNKSVSIIYGPLKNAFFSVVIIFLGINLLVDAQFLRISIGILQILTFLSMFGVYVYERKPNNAFIFLLFLILIISLD